MSFIMTFAVEAFAAGNLNPTGYVSLNKYYPLVPENPDGTLPEYYSFTTDSANYYGYIGQIRAFVPPGTVILDLSIMEAGKQMVVAHHMLPPTGKPDEPPKNYIPDNNYTLAELMAGDCWVTENSYDTLNIASDSFSPHLEISKAGWLYAKVGGGSYSQVYANRFTARVKSDVYNAWWNTYIKNEAGWNTYVEGVETYKDPTQQTPVLKVSPSLRKVGKVADTTTFEVSNTGSGTMPWTAEVTQGSDWLEIVSGSSGTNTGTITCRFAAATSTRTGIITVTAVSATPVDVTVVQEGKTMPIPATGQTTCYDADGKQISPCPKSGEAFYGQDGCYQINPMSYTKLDSNGHDVADDTVSWQTVRDNVTGLIWDNQNPSPVVKRTDIEDIIKSMNDSKYGGFIDWRLPTINELYSIVTYEIPFTSPLVNRKYFENTIPSVYWSSTQLANNVHQSWGLNFIIGWANVYPEESRCYVRAVRGEKSESISYTSNENKDTVTDNNSGLMWQQDGFASDYKTWAEALKYCENLTLGGFSDWRMPTVKEIMSLVDYSQSKEPVINTNYFTNTMPLFYWSSTTADYEDLPRHAWGVDFGDGSPFFDVKTTSSPVRAVRSISMLSVSPSDQTVMKDEGTVTFNVYISATTNAQWNVKVTQGADWFSIVSGSSGTGAGTIKCNYTSNTTSEDRTAILRISVIGDTISPVEVAVTQKYNCIPTLNNSLILNVPYLYYASGGLSLWANFVQESILTDPQSIYYRLTDDLGVIINPASSCTASTLSGDFTITIPDLLLPDGKHIQMVLKYRPDITPGVHFVAAGIPITE